MTRYSVIYSHKEILFNDRINGMQLEVIIQTLTNTILSKRR